MACIVTTGIRSTVVIAVLAAAVPALITEHKALPTVGAECLEPILVGVPAMKLHLALAVGTGFSHDISSIFVVFHMYLLLFIQQPQLLFRSVRCWPMGQAPVLS